MNFQLTLLIVLAIAILAQATNIDLANNTTFLLLLLLALGAYGFSSGCRTNPNNRSYF